jgi:hypothetical protein
MALKQHLLVPWMAQIRRGLVLREASSYLLFQQIFSADVYGLQAQDNGFF